MMTDLLLHKDRIIDRINELFIATDQKAWARVEACFTTEVMFDMHSLGGQPPQRIAAKAIAAGWQQGLMPIEAVHHQVGNYRVDIHGDEATAFCYGIALHYRRTTSGRNTRTFVGSYDFHLVLRDGDWRIDSFKFNSKFIEGNVSLETD
jgi:3-phenylpropionate/cinnamic acid dioxygenase small subunit